MTRTPDEIKKGLECMVHSCNATCNYSCTKCDLHMKGYDVNARCEDVFALVQQLEARVPRWISVEERLPETFRRVLCSDGERVFQAIYTTGSRYFPDHWEEVVCLEQNSCSTEHMHEPPTHWMPLPEPPKEE